MIQSYNRPTKYGINVLRCEKGKRSWSNVVDTTRGSYRNLPMDKRKEHYLDECVNLAGKDRIMETANELWELSKPDLDTNFE